MISRMLLKTTSTTLMPKAMMKIIGYVPHVSASSRREVAAICRKLYWVSTNLLLASVCVGASNGISDLEPLYVH